MIQYEKHWSNCTMFYGCHFGWHYVIFHLLFLLVPHFLLSCVHSQSAELGRKRFWAFGSSSMRPSNRSWNTSFWSLFISVNPLILWYSRNYVVNKSCLVLTYFQYTGFTTRSTTSRQHLKRQICPPRVDIDQYIPIIPLHLPHTSSQCWHIAAKQSTHVAQVTCTFWSLLCGCIVHIHWASKETYHFFRVTLTKIHAVNMNHIWTQIRQINP